MYCPKCGEKSENQDTYCKKCGNLLNDYSNSSSSESEEDKKIKKNAETSKTLGIISLVLSFFISIFALPIAIVGLVFGIKGKKNGKVGIILNIISIILCIGLGILSFFSIILFIGILGALFDEMFVYYDNNNYTGVYQCEMINPVFDQEENTKNLSLRLYKDNTFTLNLYDEKQNINIDGDYELYDSNYDNDKDSFQYDLKFTSDFQYINNEKIKDSYKEYYLLEEENNELTLTNEMSNIQYSCTKIK